MGLRKGKVVHFYDFSGGVNIRDPGYLIEDDQAYARVASYDGTVNVYWDKALRRRAGTLQVNDPVSHDYLVNGHRHYRSAAPTKTTFVATEHTAYDTLIQYLNSTNVLTTVTVDSPISDGKQLYFVSWKDKLYVASGDVVIQVITYAAAWECNDIAGLTSYPQFICQHRDRLWAAGGNMPSGYFECCAYDDDTSWAAGNGEAFYAGRQEGDPITQLLPRGDNLVIYKNDSIWLMQGDNLYNWFEKKANQAIGCCAPKSVADVGFGHFFLSGDNVYFFDGVNDPMPVGDPIKPWLDAIPTALRVLAAGCYHNNYYRLAFATSSASTKNDFECILDLRRFKQNKIAWWPNSGRYIAAYIPYTGPGDDQSLKYADGNAGYLQALDSGNKDNGINIREEFHSKYFVVGHPNREKEYGIFKMDHAQGIGSLDLTLYRNLNDDYMFERTIDAAGSGGTFAAATLGTSFWTSQDNARITTELPLPAEMDGYALSVGIVHEADYPNVNIYGFSLEYALRSF